jgi:CubicO group peptidase (beta-lactamase class C family)
MHRRPLILLATAAAISVAALTAAWPTDAPRVTTGFVASLLCSTTFVSGQDPDVTFAETLDAMPGAGLISWAIGRDVDRARKQVRTTLFGGAESRAVYRDGLGCMLDQGGGADATLPSAEAPARPLLPETAGPARVQASEPRLKAAIDQAFAEPEQAPQRHTHAVVVAKNGRVIGERYAEGFGVDTPILGYSATKSMTNALIGILVRQGKLAVDQPAVVPLWQNPDDPRHAITVDHLVRHTAGLALGSSLTASLASALAPVNRMKYLERDMAAFAENAALETAPGTAFNYTDGNTAILSRLIRDTVGGHTADVLRFARNELFAPLGMRNVTLEFDATGTPLGFSQMLAPARDWVRLGELYLDDGIVGGKRILPEGWVRYSTTPTPTAWPGLGAGFWVNGGDSFGAQHRRDLGMPADAFFARGMFGQYIVIVPSDRLVIARFGTTGGSQDMEGVARLVADVIAATRDERS